MIINKDPEFEELKGKVIEKVVRHNGNLLMHFIDGSYTGVYNRAEQHQLELACSNYNFEDKLTNFIK